MAIEEDRKYRTPPDNLWGVAAFPVKDQHSFLPSRDSQFFSPMKNPKLDFKEEKYKHLDYGFIVPDKSLNPNSEGVRILNASSAELIKAYENNLLDVHLYRAETIFPQNSDGFPDFSEPLTYQRKRGAWDVYVEPVRVNQECSLYVTPLRGATNTNCPMESGVSGSPLIGEINGKFYITGIATRALLATFKRYRENLALAGTFLNSNQFCSDYESVCGVPCTGLNEVLQNRD